MKDFFDMDPFDGLLDFVETMFRADYLTNMVCDAMDTDKPGDPINQGFIRLGKLSRSELIRKYGLNSSQVDIIYLLASVDDPLTPLFNLSLEFSQKGEGSETKPKPASGEEWLKAIRQKYDDNRVQPKMPEEK